MQYMKGGAFEMSANNITDILLEKLKEDSTEYKTLETDAYDLAEKKNAIRSRVLLLE